MVQNPVGIPGVEKQSETHNEPFLIPEGTTCSDRYGRIPSGPANTDLEDVEHETRNFAAENLG